MVLLIQAIDALYKDYGIYTNKLKGYPTMADMRRGNGFTLIELLVVIAIIALLMSILMPSLQRVRKQAKAVACQANLHQWAIVFSIYTDQNNGYFLSGLAEGVANIDKYWWMEPLKLCNPPSTMPTLHGRMTKHNWRTVDVKGAGDIPMFLDCAWDDAWPYHTDHPPEYDGEVVESVNNNEMKRFCLNRHDGFINGLFVDRSVRKLGLKELWKLKWHRTFDTAGPWTKAGGVQPEDWPQWMRGFKDY